MGNIEWLSQVANYPIQCNLMYMSDKGDSLPDAERLYQNPDVKFWLDQLSEASVRMNPIDNLAGVYPYEYENIMGKLYTLGVRSDMQKLDDYVDVYLEFLHAKMDQKPSSDIYLSDIANNDHELLIATFLSMLGYQSDVAVQYVTKKRIELTYQFTKEIDYDIHTDKMYPAVPKQWQDSLINPNLYSDSNLVLPTIHDYYLFASVYKTASKDLRRKVEVIVSWLFNESYHQLTSRRYGYYYLPNDIRKAKAASWKLKIPSIMEIIDRKNYKAELIQIVYLLSHFDVSKKSPWFTNLLHYLKSFKTKEGRYCFKKAMLFEQPVGFYVYGRHMGIGEDRTKPSWLEIESTYWMERILHNLR